ncbi:hypothetical protein FW778_17405 [Ginsengibacter hankyongi]|uniref:Uncharacterized protein n=1 Tax=Ginsengibacter hankyongi TaxID=2607284 RepID=A0A5J5IGE8_9BACT|nr:hypothetical protein [Ginsengibacter hankyongi]KAA9037204.1 hypothetical protein FW778_17405 [Ginsengibacter hankyongi]
MKRLILISLIGGLIFINLSSCKKVLAAVYGGTDVTVPQFQLILPQIYSVPPGEIPLGSYSYYINLDSSVRASTGGVFGANAVNSVKIKKVTIKITNPDAYDNLANIDSARVTLQSSSNNNPLQLFTIGFPATYDDTYDYTTSNSPELLPYVKGNIIIYNVFGKLRTPTNKPLGLTVDVTLRAN